jgi:hypothetical protein
MQANKDGDEIAEVAVATNVTEGNEQTTQHEVSSPQVVSE